MTKAISNTYKVRMIKLLGYVPKKKLFKNIETCPICTQNKLVDIFTYREVTHIYRHIIREENK